LGTLLFTLAILRKAGGGLALARPHPERMDLLVIAKIKTVFKVFDHAQDAIHSFFPGASSLTLRRS
jgi:anti-sigma B factor antagonist